VNPINYNIAWSNVWRVYISTVLLALIIALILFWDYIKERKVKVIAKFIGIASLGSAILSTHLLIHAYTILRSLAQALAVFIIGFLIFFPFMLIAVAVAEGR